MWGVGNQDHYCSLLFAFQMLWGEYVCSAMCSLPHLSHHEPGSDETKWPRTKPWASLGHKPSFPFLHCFPQFSTFLFIIAMESWPRQVFFWKLNFFQKMHFPVFLFLVRSDLDKVGTLEISGVWVVLRWEAKRWEISSSGMTLFWWFPWMWGDADSEHRDIC